MVQLIKVNEKNKIVNACHTNIGDIMMHLFCSLRSKRCDSVSSLKITWQSNIPHDTSVHLFCSLRSKRCDSVSSSKITWQSNITHQTSVHLFCSLRSKRCDS